MSAGPVAVLLLLDAVLFLTFLSSGTASRNNDSIFLSLLFFFSGMPALIYQIVWQRALFAIYGVNAQSVAVVVTAFMLGLGAGSLVGGCLSARFPKHGILIFGIAEVAIAIFGLPHPIARGCPGVEACRALGRYREGLESQAK